jgi:hypothetical protein
MYLAIKNPIRITRTSDNTALNPKFVYHLFSGAPKIPGKYLVKKSTQTSTVKIAKNNRGTSHTLEYSDMSHTVISV